MKRGSEKQTTSDRYFGSIRFFKNLILLAVLLLIAIPTIAAVQQNIRGNHLTNEVIEYQEKYDAATKEIRDLESAVESMRTEQTEYSSEPNAELIEYQELYPDFYAPDPKPEMSSQEKTMYLTFDDGPSASTPEFIGTERKKCAGNFLCRDARRGNRYFPYEADGCGGPYSGHAQLYP